MTRPSATPPPTLDGFALICPERSGLHLCPGDRSTVRVVLADARGQPDSRDDGWERQCEGCPERDLDRGGEPGTGRRRPAAAFGVDQAGLAEGLEVVGDRRPGQLKGRGEVAAAKSNRAIPAQIACAKAASV
jgi:hypothetical protein